LIIDGIVADRETAKAHQDRMSNPEIAAYLRSRDNHNFLDLYPARSAGMYSLPQVFRDGVVLPKDKALEAFQDRARYNAVPVILGSNRDEYKLFMARKSEYVATYFGFFRRIRDRDLYELVSSYRADGWKATGVDEMARVLRESQGPTVYAYRFDWDEEPTLLGMDLSVLLGAAHGLEIPFVFGDFDSGFLGPYMKSDENYAGRQTLSDAMSSYWAEFAYSGSPGRGRNGAALEWKAWDNSPGRPKFIIFDTPVDPGIRMSADTIRLSEVNERLLAETGFASQEKHCEMYVNLLEDSDLWDDGAYARLGREGCTSYPMENYVR
jgi:para-nitrobenzyl esterase